MSKGRVKGRRNKQGQLRIDPAVKLFGEETIAVGRNMLEVVAHATHTYWLLYASDTVAAKVGLGVVAMNNSALFSLMMGVFSKGLARVGPPPEVSNAGSHG
jgi:hypothetical protein